VYNAFFGFNKKPFRKTPDPQFIFMSPCHKQAYERMRYCVEEKEIMLLTGGIGMGKTTLSRYLIDTLEPEEAYRPVLIINPSVSPNQLLRAIVQQMGAKKPKYFKSALLDQLQDLLFSAFAAGITPVIILDESQLIRRKATYEELRLLTNFQLDDENLFALILIGQPELEKKMSRPNMEAFRQRIGMRYLLKPLAPPEVREYIAFRLQTAGGAADLALPEAVDLVAATSGGVPRIINNIMSLALLQAFSLGEKSLTKELVADAVKELKL